MVVGIFYLLVKMLIVVVNDLSFHWKSTAYQSIFDDDYLW